MAKTYIDTVKYLVYADMEIDGMVEKPDVVGAVFGQTEGLLGDELDLRELQKNGRIGRIEVDLKTRGGKSVGKVLLPSSLDMVETSILAAALESVDRVGPCDARINVEKIEDTRNVKRKQVVDRAKVLLKTLLTTEIPESKEISELVRQEVKVAEISAYGPEKLPSGPNVQNHDSLIIVEGRADVLNLLKNDINNVIAVGGANVPKTLAALCKEKEVTAFLDGDRGGDIILRELMQATDIDFVARAPPGKEVEELPRKLIIKALRSRVPIEQALAEKGDNSRRQFVSTRGSNEALPFASTKGNSGLMEARHEALPLARREERYLPEPAIPMIEPAASAQQTPLAQEAAPRPLAQGAPVEVPPELLRSLDELENTLRARLYDDKFGLKSEIPVRDLMGILENNDGVYAVVLDGIITQRLVDLAENKGARIMVGVRMGNVFRKPDALLLKTKA